MKRYLKIIGSISPYSTKKESCPGYFIKLEKVNLLLDCGPGVCSGLNIPKDLEKLVIFISHFHKDHYSDLSSLAYASYVYHNLGILTKKIKVYIPKILNNDSSYYDYLMIKNMKEHYFEFIEYDEESVINFNDINVTFSKNYHSVTTYSIKLTINNDESIVYASDIGYKGKNKIVDFSKNACILLIESTFVDSDNVNSEYHLSALQAAKIAKNANVKKMILTHFWPEYNAVKYKKEARTIFKNTYCAKKNRKFLLK